MKNFVKRHLTGILAVFLLSVIAVLGYAVSRGTVVYSSTLGEDDLTPASAVGPEAPKVEEPVAPSPDYKKVLPKSASPSDEYLFTQKICGVGNVTLRQSHVTPMGLYLLADTDCKEGDVDGERPTVGILKLDAVGNLVETVSLPAGVPTYYVASQISPLGLVVVTKNSSRNYLYVNVVPYGSGDVKTSLVSYAEHVEIYATDDGFLLFSGDETEGVLYEYGENGHRFLTLPANEIVKFFEYLDHYTIFFNAPTGYGYCEVRKKTFVIHKEQNFSTGRLLDILPVESDGQKLIAVLDDGGTVLKKYDPTSMNESAERKIGSYAVLGLGTDGEKIYMAVKGAVNGIVVADGDLSTTFSATDGNFLPKSLLDYYYDEGSFYLLLSGEERSALVKIDESGSKSVYLPPTENARLCPNVNGTFTVAVDGKYYGYNAIDLYGLTI